MSERNATGTNGLSGVSSFLAEGMKVMFYLKPPHELALNHEDAMPEYLLDYGVPMFFLLIALEWGGLAVRHFFGGHKNTNTHGGTRPVTFYRLNDFIVSTTLGSAQTVFTFLHEYLGIVGQIAVYNFLYQYRLTTIDSKEWVWTTFIVLMLWRDFGYYWNHRFLHEFHTLWSTHSVHHSGEDYNLATGLRQGILQPITTVFFQFGVVFLGFPVEAFAAHAHLNTLYQFWIHTDLVNRMPFGLEYVLNGPMAHRMHHRYPGNRNYGAVFIIWDRMFGTYEPETKRMDAYGLARQPNTFSVAKLNTNHFKAMSHIGRGDPWKGTWLFRAFARRIRARWTVSVSALFEPIPPLEKDLRISHGPIREKWNGEGPASCTTNVLMVTTCSTGIVLGLLVMIFFRKAEMSLFDVVVGSLASMIVMECGTQIADCPQKQIYISLFHRAFALTTILGVVGMVVTWLAVTGPLRGVLMTIMDTTA